MTCLQHSPRCCGHGSRPLSFRPTRGWHTGPAPHREGHATRGRLSVSSHSDGPRPPPTSDLYTRLRTPLYGAAGPRGTPNPETISPRPLHLVPELRTGVPVQACLPGCGSPLPWLPASGLWGWKDQVCPGEGSGRLTKRPWRASRFPMSRSPHASQEGPSASGPEGQTATPLCPFPRPQKCGLLFFSFLSSSCSPAGQALPTPSPACPRHSGGLAALKPRPGTGG